jgi:hypothetical protein
VGMGLESGGGASRAPLPRHQPIPTPPLMQVHMPHVTVKQAQSAAQSTPR